MSQSKSPAAAAARDQPTPFDRARYLLAAHQPRQLPPDGGFEVAFAGRSNAGKSSALNALCRQGALARVSKTPGRTQQLVYFELPQFEQRYLVDLPGYGYAKVPQDLQAHWQAFIADWFATRQALRGLVQAVRMELARAFGEGVGVQAFSAEARTGVEQAREVVSGWLELPTP